MFDIGFFELSLIGVVALVVIGPERLPSVARTAGKWLGRANRFVSNIKEDISKEIKDEELQKILQQQKILAEEFKQAAEQTTSTINSINPTEQLNGLLEIDESASSASKNTKKKKKKKKKKSNETLSITTAESANTINPETVSSITNKEMEVVADSNNHQTNNASPLEKNE
jgi:sec-independent protein translocase protein TatB